MTAPSVHILWHGAVLCGSLHGQPRSWGNVARWVGANDPSWRQHATCATCREQAALLGAKRELAAAIQQLEHDLSTPRLYPLGLTPITR